MRKYAVFIDGSRGVRVRSDGDVGPNVCSDASTSDRKPSIS